MKLERKELGNVEVKFGTEPGSFTARFAQLNIKDLDGDVTKHGAFKENQQVRITQFGHNWSALPVGKGTIRTDDTWAYVDGQFFLTTQMGKETYETVKQLEDLSQWSYGFKVDKKSFGDFNGEQVRFLELLDTFEVSPVLIGAGIGTRTDSIKGFKGHKDSTDEPPEGSYEDLIEDLTEAVQQLAQTPFGGSVGYVRIEETFPDYCIACLVRFDDNDYDETYWRVPYTLDVNGDPVLGAPQEVEQTWQPVSAPAGMMEMAGATPAETKRLFLHDEGKAALAAVGTYVARTSSLAELRVKEGRALSTTRATQMGEIAGALREHADHLDTIVIEAAPAPKAAPVTHSRQAEIFRFQALLAGIAEGVPQ